MRHPEGQASRARSSATEARRARPQTKKQKGWRRPPGAVGPAPWRQNRSPPLLPPQYSQPKTPFPRTTERASGHGCVEDVVLTRATPSCACASVESRPRSRNPSGCPGQPQGPNLQQRNPTLAKLLLSCGHFFDAIEVGLITEAGVLGHEDGSLSADGHLRGDDVLRPVPPAG